MVSNISFFFILNHLLFNSIQYIFTYFLMEDKRRDTNTFKRIIFNEHKNISGYFKTALNTCRKYADYIISSMTCHYTNGVIEGINNKIKVIKRIAFGYRSFYHFRNRILIICNLISLGKKSAYSD